MSAYLAGPKYAQHLSNHHPCCALCVNDDKLSWIYDVVKAIDLTTQALVITNRKTTSPYLAGLMLVNLPKGMAQLIVLQRTFNCA